MTSPLLLTAKAVVQGSGVVDLGQHPVTKQESVGAVGISQASGEVTPCVDGQRAGRRPAGIGDIGEDTIAEQEVVINTVGIDVVTEDVAVGIDAAGSGSATVGHIDLGVAVAGLVPGRMTEA